LTQDIDSSLFIALDLRSFRRREDRERREKGKEKERQRFTKEKNPRNKKTAMN
jgi:hypothetical protein